MVEPLVPYRRRTRLVDRVLSQGAVIIQLRVVVLQLGLELQFLLLVAAERLVGIRKLHLQRLKLRHVGLELLRQAAQILGLEFRDGGLQAAHLVSLILQLVVKEDGGGSGLVVLHPGVLLGELSDHFPHHRLSLEPIGISE